MLLLSALSAVLFAFCFPFASAWWLAWLAFVPLYYALAAAGGNVRRGAIIGGVWGFLLHIVACFWMIELGVVPWLGVSVFETGAFLAWGGMAAWTLFRLPGWARPVVFAALWVCLEYARTLSVMAFPWFPVAATQVPVLAMVQIASVTGQWGVSFAVVLVNALLVESFAAHRAKYTTSFKWFAGAAVWVPVTLMSIGFGLLFATQGLESLPANRVERRVAIIQGNLPKPAADTDHSEYRYAALATYLQMTRAAGGGNLTPPPPLRSREGESRKRGDTGSPVLPPLSASERGGGGEVPGGKVDFILWPETVVPGYLLQDPTLLTAITLLTREMKTDLLVGTPGAGANGESFNSVVYVGKRGDVRRNYSKQRLVPMGEFFPFRDSLKSVYEQYHVPNDDLTPGTEPGTFDVGGGNDKTRIGLLICFESVFPYISRDRVKSGATVLVQATSDQTYDGTPNPRQHADLCVLRAIETRRYFVRAGATGLSQIIDAGGRVRRNIPTGKTGAIVDTFVCRSGETFFVRYGDWFVAVCGIVSGLAGVYVATRPRPASVAPPVVSIEEGARPE